MSDTPSTQGASWEERFVEDGAALEHSRWAGWQEYFFSKCVWSWTKEIIPGHNTLCLPKELHERWLRQIKTPYKDLSEKEKESDRAEVRKYLPLIKEIASKERVEGEKALLARMKKHWGKNGGSSLLSLIVELDTLPADSTEGV